MKAEEAIAAGENRLAHLRLSLSVADEGLIRDLVGALKDLAAENERLRQEREELLAANGELNAQCCKEAMAADFAFAKGRAEGIEEAAKHLESRANKITPWATVGHDLRRGELFESAKYFRALSAAVPTNQCDGCNSGMPIEDGIHQHNGHPHMCCTKGKYSAVVPVEVEK